MLPSRCRRAGNWRAVFSIWIALAVALMAGEALAKAGKNKPPKLKKKRGAAAAASASASGSPGEISLTNIPLPIGHEAKGLVLPDFNTEGKLVGKFEAGTARRIDQDHVRFQDLKITTFTPENQLDLQVEMHTSLFNLATRILTSEERSTVKRADFNIVGDSVEFDTARRTGKMTGNVKMVINSNSKLIEKTNE